MKRCSMSIKLHNSTRQKTIDNPPRWAIGRRSKVTCSDVSESSSFTPESNSIINKYIQTDVPAKYVAQHPMNQNFATIIQKDEPAIYIAQRPMDSGVNVLSFVSNVQPQCAFTTLPNGAPSPRNYLLSIVNLSESAFRHKTKVLLPSNTEFIASHEHDDAEDDINSMTQTQNQSTTIKSHSN